MTLVFFIEWRMVFARHHHRDMVATMKVFLFHRKIQILTSDLEQLDMVDVYYKTELIRLFLSLQQFTTGDLKSLSGKLLFMTSKFDYSHLWLQFVDFMLQNSSN